MGKLRDKLGEADAVKLSLALRRTIDHITIGKRGKGKGCKWFGVLKFRPGLGCDIPIKIRDEDLRPETNSLRLIRLARKHRNEITSPIVQEELGISKAAAYHQLLRAVDQGMLYPSVRKGGHVAVGEARVTYRLKKEFSI